jgi:hypothetical protein
MEALDGVGFRPAGDAYLLQRLRLNLDLKPLPWLGFSFQTQDSRAFFTNGPPPSSQKSPLDLRIGYVQIGDPEAGPFSVRAGRQGLTLGEGRLVAESNWSNVGRTLDGVRVTLRRGKFRAYVFSGVLVKVDIEGFDFPTPGQHFHGVYGSLDKVVPNATIEPYLFWRLEHNVKGEKTGYGHLSAKTAGLRWVGKLPLRFDYGVEMAVQRGRRSGEPVAAWAGHWVAGHTLPYRRRPRLFLELNRATGDDNRSDGRYGAFDPLFPSSHDKYGVADQFVWTNLVHLRPGFQFQALDGLTAGAAYNSFWLANPRDGIYGGGKVIIASPGAQGRHIAHEADLQVQWTLGRHTALDFAFGHIFPGESLRKAGRTSPYNCWVLGVTQRF